MEDTPLTAAEYAAQELAILRRIANEAECAGEDETCPICLGPSYRSQHYESCPYFDLYQLRRRAGVD